MINDMQFPPKWLCCAPSLRAFYVLSSALNTFIYSYSLCLTRQPTESKLEVTSSRKPPRPTSHMPPTGERPHRTVQLPDLTPSTQDGDLEQGMAWSERATVPVE